MSLVDLIEQCGRDVESGQMSREAAVQHIQEFSDGGLTRLGAEDSLDRWRTIRAAYDQVFMDASVAIVEIETNQGRNV